MKPAPKRLLLAALGSLLLINGQSAISQSPDDMQLANGGYVSDMGRSAQWHLEQSRKMIAAVDGLQSQNPGKVDAFVLVAGIDADPVFGREAAEAKKVLERRFGAQGRSILLAAGDGAAGAEQAYGLPQNLWSALAGIAAKMDKDEDVLVLYTTSHGGKGVGIVYNDKGKGFGLISPQFLAKRLDELGIKRRLVMISACYSGAFIPPLKSDETMVMTAASAVRPSFGCNPGNDWTFFGDALINNAMRENESLPSVNKKAVATIAKWEKQFDLPSSDPQFFAGAKVSGWLAPLEMAMPAEKTSPIGNPAIGVLDEAQNSAPAKSD